MRTLKKSGLIVCFFLSIILPCLAQNQIHKPIRLAVASITHGHASFILGRKDKTDFELVGVYEANGELAQQYATQFGYSTKLIYNNLTKMLDSVKPEAVVVFGSIYEHMAIVEACAPRGIHVMVEKPLATNIKHVKRMQELAKKYNIYLLTDFESSWYPTTAKTYQLVVDSAKIGKIRKMVVHDGHIGPKEIGVGKEFLSWLTDPVLNGGGAIIDFGCYGANLSTYLHQGQEPISITAVTQHFKPDIYPKVDDEATIIISYPSSQCIIQASWNWPFNRKDMEVYGETGYVNTIDNKQMRIRYKNMENEQLKTVTSKDVTVYEDPFEYFANVILGNIKMTKYDLYSLENNITVVKILEAAIESAKTGKAVAFPK